MTEQHNLATYEGLKEAFLEQKQRAEAAEERCKRLMAPVSDREIEEHFSLIPYAGDETYVAFPIDVYALLAERGKNNAKSLSAI